MIQTCILGCEHLGINSRNHGLGSFVRHQRLSDVSVLTTGYSLQFSGELLKCNCLLLLLSKSCHSCCTSFLCPTLTPGNLFRINRNYMNNAVLVLFLTLGKSLQSSNTCYAFPKSPKCTSHSCRVLSFLNIDS